MNMKLSERSLANVTVFSSCALLFIWVVPETIAFRHLLLIIGAISSGFLLRKNLQLIYPLRPANLPLYILFSLFIWVAIHWSFFSLNSELEFSEIKSLWVRTFLGSIMGVGLGISLRRYSSLCKYLYCALFSTPLINLGSYVYASVLNHALILPIDFEKYFFTKIETAYFGGIAAAVSVGQLVYLFKCDQYHNRIGKVIFWFLGIILVLVSAIISRTKNGMLIIAILLFALIIIFIMNALRGHIKRSSVYISAIVLFVVLVTASMIHNKYASAGWSNLYDDVKVAIDIDKNTQWNQVEGEPIYPLNGKGETVAVNTYSRVAWAAVGLRLIWQYPLGYGSINHSFDGMQDVAGIEHGHKGQTHSGWIDYGLAFGIPGLLILISTLILNIYFGLKQKDQLNLLSISISCTLLIFCIFAEMSWKQYFESMIFFIAFIVTITAYKDIIE